jgi:hypothetical protein
MEAGTLRIRKVNAEVLAEPARGRASSPRELKRLQLESKLERAIRDARTDRKVAFLVTLEDEKAPAVRQAFNRVKAREGADGVNLVTVGGELYIAQVAQRRGRRPKAAA